MENNLPSTKILGTGITTASKVEVLEYIFKRLQNRGKKFYVVTPNPEILMYATASKDFQAILNKASVSIPDGVGVLMAGVIQKKVIKSRITGVDLMLELCLEASKRGLTIGLLGGRDRVAEKSGECLVKMYPGLRIVLVAEDFPIGFVPHIDMLFVAYGFPKQEEWIAKNLSKIPVTLAMGVGGAFDYISGSVTRAPKVVRDLGMEWAFRLVHQPWRAKRQTALPKFLFKILQEKR